MKSCDMVIIVPVDGVTGEEAMRVQVWETVAELLRPELGKLYRQFNPSGSVWEHKYPRPFGVVLGRQEPEVFRELLKAGEEAQRSRAVGTWGLAYSRAERYSRSGLRHLLCRAAPRIRNRGGKVRSLESCRSIRSVHGHAEPGGKESA